MKEIPMPTYYNVATVLVDEKGNYYFEYPMYSQYDNCVIRIKAHVDEFQEFGQIVQACLGRSKDTIEATLAELLKNKALKEQEVKFVPNDWP